MPLLAFNAKHGIRQSFCNLYYYTKIQDNFSGWEITVTRKASGQKLMMDI